MVSPIYGHYYIPECTAASKPLPGCHWVEPPLPRLPGRGMEAGKGQCFWRSVSNRQHAWKSTKHKALATLLPCLRHAEAKHRGQWASQVEIAAYAQAFSTPPFSEASRERA